MDLAVLLDLHLAVPIGRDNRGGAAFDQSGTQNIAIAAQVGNRIVGSRPGVDGQHSDLGIMYIMPASAGGRAGGLFVVAAIELGVPATYRVSDDRSRVPLCASGVRWTMIQLRSTESLAGTPLTSAS